MDPFYIILALILFFVLFVSIGLNISSGLEEISQELKEIKEILEKGEGGKDS